MSRLRTPRKPFSFHEILFVELDTPSSIYSLAISSTHYNIGFVASRHMIQCFSGSLDPIPRFGSFYPFEDFFAPDFHCTLHTEVLSAHMITFFPSLQSALAFVTYTPGLDTLDKKSLKKLHICVQEFEEDKEAITEEEDLELGELFPTVDQHVSNFQSKYQGFYNEENEVESVTSILILSGSDRKLHGYVEVNNRCVEENKLPFMCEEVLLSEYLPELKEFEFRSCVLSLDISFVYGRRIIIIGMQDGTLMFSSSLLVEGKWKSLELKDIGFLDGPIACITLLSHVKDLLCNNPLGKKRKKAPMHPLFKVAPKQQKEDSGPVDLLVGSPTGYAILYEDILTNKLSVGHILPHSTENDSISCSLVFHLFGQCYIVLGTYSGGLLFYNKEKGGSVTFVEKKIISFPIVGLGYAELHGDGSPSIVVNTTNGVHIYEVPTDALLDVIVERLIYFEEYHSQQEDKKK